MKTGIDNNRTVNLFPMTPSSLSFPFATNRIVRFALFFFLFFLFGSDLYFKFSFFIVLYIFGVLLFVFIVSFLPFILSHLIDHSWKTVPT